MTSSIRLHNTIYITRKRIFVQYKIRFFVKALFSICLTKIKGFNIKLKYIRFFIILWYNIRIGTIVKTTVLGKNI